MRKSFAPHVGSLTVCETTQMSRNARQRKWQINRLRRLYRPSFPFHLVFANIGYSGTSLCFTSKFTFHTCGYRYVTRVDFHDRESNWLIYRWTSKEIKLEWIKKRIFSSAEGWRNFLSHLTLKPAEIPLVKTTIANHLPRSVAASSLLIKITFCSAISALRSRHLHARQRHSFVVSIS